MPDPSIGPAGPPVAAEAGSGIGPAMPPGIGPAMPPGAAGCSPDVTEPATDGSEIPDAEKPGDADAEAEGMAAGHEAGSERKKQKAPKKPKVVKAELMCQLQHEDLDWIWVGGAEDARDCVALRKHNIRYVLNCTMDRAAGGVLNFHEKDKNFQYRRLAMGDNATEHLSQHFEAAWEFFEHARIREDGGVLVHCQQGVSRSVSMCCSYLMKYYRFSFDDALALCKKSRSQANPNEGFTLQLRELERTLKETNGYEKVPPRRKRPADSQIGGMEKKRSVGVARGPPGPAKGPTMGPAAGPQVGPARGPSMGPSVGPQAGPARGPAAGPSVGPSAGPTIKGPARPPPAPEPPVVIDKVKTKKITAGPARPNVGGSTKTASGPAKPAEARKGRSIDLT